MKTYLITGAAGFIGANFLKYILKKHKDIKVIEHIAIIIGCVVSLGCTAGFFMTNKKSNLITE